MNVSFVMKDYTIILKKSATVEQVIQNRIIEGQVLTEVVTVYQMLPLLEM
ncbi:hypothetical protein [Sphingobacterium sp. IITKGP-BTPF85]|nr:hypothetical protein [Sphingobacterium sp. IITKGP-BTPF85]KKX49402.1 hypothetical protein L950_0215830 [Sphingobacterium sp. IITKGP-BTPF85]